MNQKLKELTSEDSDGMAVYDWILAKDTEIAQLRARCALLDSLLSVDLAAAIWKLASVALNARRQNVDEVQESQRRIESEQQDEEW